MDSVLEFVSELVVLVIYLKYDWSPASFVSRLVVKDYREKHIPPSTPIHSEPWENH